MTIFFNGWMGYGNAIVAGTLIEPIDPFYNRRPFILGNLDNGVVSDVGSGTVGPATTTWNTIGFAALFDAPSGGNMLASLPLSAPVAVSIGGTITSGPNSNKFAFPDLQNDSRHTRIWPAGSVVATTSDGRQLVAGVALQFSSGMLTAQTNTFGMTVSMANLPSTQPIIGSGQLWNNGGVVSIA